MTYRIFLRLLFLFEKYGKHAAVPVYTSDTIYVYNISNISYYYKIIIRQPSTNSFLIIFGLDVTGISGKSQILFAIVYTTRYLDLVTTYISAYNTFMKIIFIAASYATVFLMYMKFKATYDHNHDTFRYVFCVK